MLVLLGMMTFAGCATSSGSAPARELPPRPAVFAPVPQAMPKSGNDARVALAASMAETKAANDRLARFGTWYDRLRAEYAKPR